MAKIRNKKKLLWCLKQFHEGKESQKWIAPYLEIKPRRFRQLYSVYKQTLKVPDVGSKVGRPKKTVPTQWRQNIEDQWTKHRLNALTFEKVTQYETKVRIPHNTIHRIMLEKGFCKRTGK